MLVPPSTEASRYHNCCIDGSTSLEYFGYHLVNANIIYPEAAIGYK
jgi:hypothetical protein